METPSKRTMGWDAPAEGRSSGFLDMSAEIGDLEEGLLGRPIRIA
jgi:hypothetical protein